MDDIRPSLRAFEARVRSTAHVQNTLLISLDQVLDRTEVHHILGLRQQKKTLLAVNYRRLARSRGEQKAIVATERTLLTSSGAC